jgi:hypothetical protein
MPAPPQPEGAGSFDPNRSMNTRLIPGPQAGTAVHRRLEAPHGANVDVFRIARVDNNVVASRDNIDYCSAHAFFEVIHRTAPKCADKFVADAGVVTSDWLEAADLVNEGLHGAIAAEIDTYAFHRSMDGAKLVARSLCIRD